ncbi:hypothetical protein [Sphingomonas flavescens]|uniref:hypothetical protein n=1 Tax=Sphingomonas flavescens TaxID=3132797 RepID=UPI002803D369|nr:hypothetical protein [Sphingomonas limnosediminicola]
MIQILLTLLAAVTPDIGPEPYPLSGHATAEGAKVTVIRLLGAVRAKNDAAYDKIARGMALLLAPDMAMKLDRTQFEQIFASCNSLRVVSSRPFPNSPAAQAVRIEMMCTDKDRARPQPGAADIMADNDHAFAIYPGSADRMLPLKAPQ